MFKPFAAALLAAPFALLALPAAAQDMPQDVGEEKVNMVIVYGDDRCPQSTDSEITVCARKAETERYRIPEDLRLSDDPANTSWAQRVESFEMVGAFGAMSCSPAGLAGATGCTQQMIEAAYKDKDSASAVRFAQLIEQARAERLEGVDEEAAEEQARVEMIEREYMQRLEGERSAETPDEAAQTPPPLTAPPQG